MTGEEKAAMMRKAIALYFECSEEDIGNFIFGCERKLDDTNVVFSGGYAGIAHWYLIGMCDELRHLLEMNRIPAPEQAMMPSIEIPSGNDFERMLRGES